MYSLGSFKRKEGKHMSLDTMILVASVLAVGGAISILSLMGRRGRLVEIGGIAAMLAVVVGAGMIFYVAYVTETSKSKATEPPARIQNPVRPMST